MADLVPSPPLARPTPLAGPLVRLRHLSAQPAVRRALPWFFGAGAIGAVALAWTVLATPPQRQLYDRLSDGERAGVVAALETAGIVYAIDNATGALSVAEDDLYRARMLVAADGALAAPDAQSTLDSLPLGASRTLEGERLRAARERELMLTIQEIDGVESVRVHLAEGNKSVFVREDAPPSASIMVRMARGRQLGESQVAAIVNLVAASVPGLSPDAVRVVDQQGRLLSDRAQTRDNDRIALQARMEEKLRGQIDQLLAPILGAEGFSSEIQVELDLDEVTSARESYEKQGALRSESQAQSQGLASAAAGGVPGVLANTPPPATTLQPGAPQSTAPAAGTALPTGESSTNRTYELGREVAVSSARPGKVRRLSVAVAINQAAVKQQGKPADLDALKALVSAAVGADAQRGDQVAVLIRPFEPAVAEAPPFYEATWFAMVIRGLLGLIGVALVLLLLVRPLLRVLRREPAAAPTEAAGSTAEAATAGDPALLGRQVELAQRLVEEKPEEAIVALRRMLRTTPDSAS